MAVGAPQDDAGQIPSTNQNFGRSPPLHRRAPNVSRADSMGVSQRTSRARPECSAVACPTLDKILSPTMPNDERLGGAHKILDVNSYKHSHASLCLVLPPVGSARSAILLLECIEHFIGSTLFSNPKIQIQVCSPGRLDGNPAPFQQPFTTATRRNGHSPLVQFRTFQVLPKDLPAA